MTTNTFDHLSIGIAYPLSNRYNQQHQPFTKLSNRVQRVSTINFPGTQNKFNRRRGGKLTKTILSI